MEVAIAEPVPGASIAYTLQEGDDPHWLLYAGPVAIKRSGALRVRTIRYRWAENAEVSACFGIGGAPPACP